MSRKQQRLNHAAKRKAKTAARIALIEKIDTVVRPLNCRVVGFGPSAVGVQGDARTYGIAVILRFPSDATIMQINEVSTQVTNHVREVTRVLMDIPLETPSNEGVAPVPRKRQPS